MHGEKKWTRRGVLKGAVTATATLAAGRAAAVAGAGGAASDRAAGTTPAATRERMAAQSAALALGDVKLLAGPFLDAQKRDGKYLLSLEPDRLLANFRINAGLAAKAAVYGGWESVQTWADIRAHGHTLGHYLSACAMMYASTNEDAFKKRCDGIVAALAECQAAGIAGATAGAAALPGLICAFPDKAAQIDNLIAGRRAIGVPWYTLHKIFAGLRDAHLHTKNAAAREVLVKLTDWAAAATQNMADAAFERMLGTEHGGMNEVLADVFALTGDGKYLTLAERFCHKAVLEPLSQGRDTLDGLHSNTQIPKIIGFERLYRLTGNEKYKSAAEFFWKTVTEKRSFATGGNGDNEHFFPVGQFTQHVSSAKTMETCCSHNMLKLTRALWSRDPRPEYAEYFERAIFNTILASQDPDSGMMTYFQSTRPGYMKLFCTPVDSFWCCTGTGMENHAKYGESIYFLEKGSAPGVVDSLYVNLFISSTLAWSAKGVSVKQVTSFPESGKVRLEFTTINPEPFTLRIRQPAWCAGASVRINGAAMPTAAQSGGFIQIGREWNTGDVVELDLPMTLRAEWLPGTKDQAAFAYGPIVLVGTLGKQGIAPGADIIVNERTYGAVLNEAVEVPVLSGGEAPLVERITPGEKPLTFVTKGMLGGKAVEMTLVPYYRVAHERYNMYWKVV